MAVNSRGYRRAVALTMKPVIQEEKTGCAIASAAAVSGLSYRQARQIANRLGIHAGDSALWSETDYMRRLLQALGVGAGDAEKPFTGWGALPSCALLAIKWHEVRGMAYWHWVVFVRDHDRSYVLDPKRELRNNVRTDFGRMRPKWYIEI